MTISRAIKKRKAPTARCAVGAGISLFRSLGKEGKLFADKSAQSDDILDVKAKEFCFDLGVFLLRLHWGSPPYFAVA